MEVVQLGLRHLGHSTGIGGSFARCADLCRQRLPLLALCGQKAVDGGEVGLIKDLVDDAVLLALRHPGHTVVQVGQDIIQPAHVALRVVDGESQLLHQLGGVIGGRL